MGVSMLHACVTGEQEPGSKEHMFRVLWRPVLWVNSIVWVWVVFQRAAEDKRPELTVAIFSN